jgi:hypothetical protein
MIKISEHVKVQENKNIKPISIQKDNNWNKTWKIDCPNNVWLLAFASQFTNLLTGIKHRCSIYHRPASIFWMPSCYHLHNQTEGLEMQCVHNNTQKNTKDIYPSSPSGSHHILNTHG